MHLRVKYHRGKAATCVWGCESVTGFQWANLTGDYNDINDYANMCRSCHKRFYLAVASMGHEEYQGTKYTKLTRVTVLEDHPGEESA